MRTAKVGDRVQVHYVKRFEDGSVASSRAKGPVEVVVGVNHPRLPGIGLALVGLTPGAKRVVTVPAELAYGFPDPDRIHRWSRSRFPQHLPLPVGKWVRIMTNRGRHRWVRIVEIRGPVVTVDTNHRFAGQDLQLELELVGLTAQNETNGQ
jgi:peptidylprolyl isomerase